MNELRRPSAFDLLRGGPYTRLLVSHTISSLGDWVTLFATFSLGAELAGGGNRAGLGILVPLVARILPGLLFGVIGGVVADKWNRKAIMVGSDLGRAVLVGALVFVANFRDLFLLTFAIEVLALVRQPARESVVPQLIDRRYLMAANGLNLFGAYGTAPVGSALFAVIAQFGSPMFEWAANPGAAAAFALDAVTFVTSGILVLTIPIPVRAAGKTRIRETARPLADIADGFRFVARTKEVRRLVLGMAAGLFGGGALFVLGQPFSRQVLGGGNSGYGILVTALGVGVGLGMGAMTVWGRHLSYREVWFAAGLSVTGFAIAAASFTSTVWGAGSWVFAAGLGTGIAYVTGFTHLHAVVTDELRGRTFAALFAAARGALLVSFGLAGIGAAALAGVFPGLLASGTRAVIVVSGVVIFLTGGSFFWSVREHLRPEPMDRVTLRTLRDAADSITWMRGSRSRGEDDEE